ncbi:hypothetical protein [Streptomyces sp. NPDC005525]|uniref:hypothetical protein n=1 Tax=Streptomyces sp. NPDC005525 TaxID=3364720 RepID=UPI00367A10C4
MAILTVIQASLDLERVATPGSSMHVYRGYRITEGDMPHFGDRDQQVAAQFDQLAREPVDLVGGGQAVDPQVAGCPLVARFAPCPCWWTLRQILLLKDDEVISLDDG